MQECDRITDLGARWSKVELESHGATFRSSSGLACKNVATLWKHVGVFYFGAATGMDRRLVA